MLEWKGYVKQAA